MVVGKGSVDMNSYWLEKSEMRALLLHFQLEIESCFWTFNSNSDLSTLLAFIFQTYSETGIKKITVRYVDFMTLQSMFKGSINEN